MSDSSVTTAEVLASVRARLAVGSAAVAVSDADLLAVSTVLERLRVVTAKDRRGNSEARVATERVSDIKFARLVHPVEVKA